MSVWAKEMKAAAAMADAQKVCDLTAQVKELEARAPTEWAYAQACQALAHWRKEARRLGKIAGVEPRDMKKPKS